MSGFSIIPTKSPTNITDTNAILGFDSGNKNNKVALIKPEDKPFDFSLAGSDRQVPGWNAGNVPLT